MRKGSFRNSLSRVRSTMVFVVVFVPIAALIRIFIWSGRGGGIHGNMFRFGDRALAYLVATAMFLATRAASPPSSLSSTDDRSNSIERFERLYADADGLRDHWKESGILYHNANIVCPKKDGTASLTIYADTAESPFVQIQQFCDSCTGPGYLSICAEKIAGLIEANGISVGRVNRILSEEKEADSQEEDLDDVRRFQGFIRNLQHVPRAECSVVRVTMMENILSGLGSQIHIMANVFLAALFRGRLFVNELFSTQYVDERICPRKNFDCLFESITSCRLEDIVGERDAAALRVAALSHDDMTKMRVLEKYAPRVSFEGLECHRLAPKALASLGKRAGLARQHDETWYFRQVMRYIWHPIPRVRSFTDALSGQIGHTASVARGVVGVHMRWNKNTWNGKGFSEGSSFERPFDFSTDEWAITAKHFASQNAADTVFLSSNAPERYQKDFVAAVAPLRVIFVPLSMWTDLSLKDTHQTGSLSFSPDAIAQLPATQVCFDDDDDVPCDLERHAYDEGTLLLATVELFARCRMLIGCYSSNVARLVHEVMAIRMEDTSALCMEVGARPPTYDMDGSAYYTCGEYEDKHSIGKKRRVFRELAGRRPADER